jgi:hypothetical protein
MDYFAPISIAQYVASIKSRSRARIAPPVPKRPPSQTKGGSKERHADKVPFLDLPGELRNQVYALLVVFPHPLRIVGAFDPQLYRRSGDRNDKMKTARDQPTWSEYLWAR